jgi:hypothetical protein
LVSTLVKPNKPELVSEGCGGALSVGIAGNPAIPVMRVAVRRSDSGSLGEAVLHVSRGILSQHAIERVRGAVVLKNPAVEAEGKTGAFLNHHPQLRRIENGAVVEKIGCGHVGLVRIERHGRRDTRQQSRVAVEDTH